MTYFVDTSGWIAHFHEGDEFHKQAEKFLKDRPSLLTSNIVLHETVAHLEARYGKKVAITAGNFILSGSVVELVPLTLADEAAAWQRLKEPKFSLSFVDTTNVILMERLGLKEIFAFDEDFRQVGLKVIP
ncbi:PIN domain-containing protein [Candidatus Shapirobacteria bacterium]|nr:PIN domain-containing protein [Candidatus Shapirobacteria bacterium]